MDLDALAESIGTPRTILECRGDEEKLVEVHVASIRATSLYKGLEKMRLALAPDARVIKAVSDFPDMTVLNQFAADHKLTLTTREATPYDKRNVVFE